MNFTNYNKELILLKIIISILFLCTHLLNNSHNIIEFQITNNIYNKSSIKISYDNSKFAIINRINCPICGLFSFYIVHLGCINKYISMGYIPIIDVMSFPNVFNGFKNSNYDNKWEFFFYQPFGLRLKEVKYKAKNIEYFQCLGSEIRPDPSDFYYNQILVNYWHDLAQKYMPIKKEIIYEANKIIRVLFQGSSNILGVKMRGTDYISAKPAQHPIPPSVEMVIYDVKNLFNKNKYDWIFLSTEDEIMKEKFIKEFNYSIKLYNPKKKIKYDYNLGKNIMLNKDIYGNLEYAKNYLINMIILSKCTDFISAKGSGAVGVFIFTNGFRYYHIYNLGIYK